MEQLPDKTVFFFFYMHSNALSCHSGSARCSRLAHNKTRGSRTTLHDIIRVSDPKRETCDVVWQWQWVSCDGDAVKPARSGHAAPLSDRSCVWDQHWNPPCLSTKKQLLHDAVVRASSNRLLVSVITTETEEWKHPLDWVSHLLSISWLRRSSFIHVLLTQSCINTYVWILASLYWNLEKNVGYKKSLRGCGWIINSSLLVHFVVRIGHSAMCLCGMIFTMHTCSIN